MSNKLPETGLLRIKDVLNYIPISKSNIWKMVKENRFPQPVKLSDRVTCWRVEDIRSFIDGGYDDKK